MSETAKSIQNAVQIVWLRDENTRFYRKGDFLAMRFVENGQESDRGRIILHRMFPFTEPWSDISVQNMEGEEIGLIASLDDFSSDVAGMLRSEIEKKYFIPTIYSILDLKEKFGISTWKVATNVGQLSFTVRDTYRSMTFSGEGRIFILDADGNRYEIPDVNKLDSRSYRKIELYI